MKYQPKNSPYCGPTSIQNALRVYGPKIPLKKILKATDAHLTDGCSEFQLMQGLQEFGFRGKPYTTNNRKTARALLASGNPFLLCVTTSEPWDHWVTVCVLDLHIGKRYFLWDSENSKKNVAENGGHSLSWRQLSRLWTAPGWAQTEPADKTFYALEVLKL